MKKFIFGFCFMAAASAFAFFIPLQEDGSVSLPTDSSVTVPMASESVVTGDRRPAGQDQPAAYVPPPQPPVEYYQPPAEVPTPRPQPQPEAPTYSGGDYSCLKAGFALAGHRNTSQKYIDMIATRMKMHHDNSLKFTLFKSEEQKRQLRFKDGLKGSIFALAALGNCNNSSYPYGGSEQAQAQRMMSLYPLSRQNENVFTDTFGISTARAVPANFSSPYNPTGIEHIRTHLRTRGRNSRLYMCTGRTTPSRDATRDLCRALFTACNRAGHGLTGMDGCNYKEPDRSGNDNGGSDNGTTTGGTTTGGDTTGGTTGSTTGGTTGSDNGNNNDGGNTGNQGETGEGSNAESGHGSDGSNDGGGQGDGPPGG